MVALNFKAQFAQDVEDGTKHQTIRQKARCQRGDELQLYTGMRTKKCRKLRDAVCMDVMPVLICDTEMYLNGKLLCEENDDRDNDFARADGFDSYMDMAAFFRDQYGPLPFRGWVIRWEPL